MCTGDCAPSPPVEWGRAQLVWGDILFLEVLVVEKCNEGSGGREEGEVEREGGEGDVYSTRYAPNSLYVSPPLLRRGHIERVGCIAG